MPSIRAKGRQQSIKNKGPLVTDYDDNGEMGTGKGLMTKDK
jgi:hypothetical protein